MTPLASWWTGGERRKQRKLELDRAARLRLRADNLIDRCLSVVLFAERSRNEIASLRLRVETILGNLTGITKANKAGELRKCDSTENELDSLQARLQNVMMRDKKWMNTVEQLGGECRSLVEAAGKYVRVFRHHLHVLDLGCKSELRNAAIIGDPEGSIERARKIIATMREELEKPDRAQHKALTAQERLTELARRVPVFASFPARLKALQQTADQFSRDYENGNYTRCVVEATSVMTAADQLEAEVLAQDKAARAHLQGWMGWAVRAEDFANDFESSLEEVNDCDTAGFLPAWERLRIRIGDYIRDRACEVGNLEQLVISQQWQGISPLYWSKDIQWQQLSKFAELTTGRIIISCPQCEVRLRVPVGKQGRVRCARCHHVFETSR